jgi:hypothetical protein
MNTYSVSVAMAANPTKATPCMKVLANSVEGAWEKTQQIVGTISGGARFTASVCDSDFNLTHFTQEGK